MINNQHNDCSDDGDYHTVDIKACDGCRSDEREQEAADHPADDAEDDIQQQPFTALVNDLACDEASDEAQNEQPMIDIRVPLQAASFLACESAG